MVHFKAAATIISSASSLKGRSLHSSSSKAAIKLEDLVDKDRVIPPHVHASNGDLDALQDSVKAFGLTLRERDRNKATLLHHAARASQLLVMRFLIEKGIELDAADESGNTALHLSVMASHTDGIHLLLDSGASCNSLNSERNSPLHLATKDLSGVSLSACLSHPVDIYIKGPLNRTILHILLECDNLEGCKVFKDYFERNQDVSGERLKFCDDRGFSPIHLAARKNSYKVLEQMITYWKEKGKSIENFFDLINEENSTPLHMAVNGGNYEVACVLLKYGANPCVLKEDMSPPLHLACSLGKLDIVKAMVEYAGAGILHQLDCYRCSPLHYSAISIHSISIISYIIKEGHQAINIDQQDSKGKTPLHISISSGNLASVKELLARGADPFLKDVNGSNALHLAVLHNRKPIIRELLEVHNSNQLITEVNCKGYSPVHIGLKLGLGDIMLNLVSPVLAQCHSQWMYVKDAHGNNYIHLAAASGDWKFLLEFLDLPNAEKLLNDTNKCGGTPLHSAAKKGQSCCIEHLLNRGAMVHKCYKGKTPLMIACVEGHIDCAKPLYKAHPFQIDWQDDLGNTALHYAAQSSSPPIIQYMLDLNVKILHNDNGQNFLDLIAASQDEDCGLAVVNHKRWQECLDVISPVGEVPMIKLIKSMPAIAKAVLDRSYRKESGSCERGNSEIFNLKYLFCLNDMHTQEKNYLPSGLSLLNRRKSTHKLTVSEFDVEAGHSIFNYRRNSTRKYPVLESEKKKVSQTMEVLQTMIRHKQVDLLIHPVVMEYMKIKWRLYGKLCYSLAYLFSFLHIIFLTSFVVVGSSSANDSSPFLGANDSSLFNDTVMLDQNMSGNETLAPDSLQVNAVGEVLRWIAVFCNSVGVIVFIMTIVTAGLKFINHTWICGLSGVLSFIFLLHPNPFNKISLLFGASACFFAWLDVFVALEFVEISGIYVTMFFKILRRAFHVLFISLFLLMAFALPLFLLGNSIKDFSNLGFSLFSVFGYMLGEIQYSLFIERSSSPNSFSLFIVVIFLAIMMSIVMANLLIGLAVGDIEQIKLNALYDRMTIEVEFFVRLDQSLPKFLHRKVVNFFVNSNDKMLPKFFHRRVSGKCKWRKGWRSIMTVGRKVLDPSNKTEESGEASRTIDTPIDIASEVTQIKKKLQEISDMMRTTQGDKCGSFDNYHQWKGRQLRWQIPQSSSISLGSSHSDLTYSFSEISGLEDVSATF